MQQVFVFLHVVGGVLMGFYFLLPFLIAASSKLSGASLAGYMSVMRTMNRVGQFGLIFELLTGGYLIPKYTYNIWWLIASLVLLVAMGAVTGIMGVRMKKLIDAATSGGSVDANRNSAAVLSWISAVFLLAIIFLMYSMARGIAL
ncbi:hypothetical protein ACFFK0_16985 [Paenibacillus chartarius]|uniref:DUF2269 family protein n=1 Tax=Paenibacillus chartarius TaxID=747481 RepID=A0ABV6DNA4_9BACL